MYTKKRIVFILYWFKIKIKLCKLAMFATAKLSKEVRIKMQVKLVCLCTVVYAVHQLRLVNKHRYIPVMLAYKHYINTVTPSVSKHTATDLSYYRINITLTQSHLPSVNTPLESCHVII